MGRNKKKQGVDEDNVKLLKNEDSDEDVPDEVHDRLLESIKQFHGKPKIVPATRNEPAAEVSEFNLKSNKGDDKRAQFREKDLIQALKKKQPKVARKLQSVKKPQTLPKPLETVHEKKVQREIGFGNVKKRLGRWSDVVKSNRLADQLTFPLQNDKIEVYDHTSSDLFSSLPNPTPLEKELAQVLNSSEVAKEHEEKLEKSRFRLTLKELIEKRKMYAKVKAQASYKIAKAWRQNKIKSKKYHRILRREKTKQQMKEFENLQKTDPEAALKQLELLEKSRAEERATLRHRNTGKWAKNQLIRATYNKESRVALSEQLQKNRELTQKKFVEETDSDSDVSGDHDTAEKLTEDANNPWIAENNEYAQFVTGYKKFWEEKAEKEKNQQFDDNFMNDKTEQGCSSLSEIVIDENETALDNVNEQSKKRKKSKTKKAKKIKTVAEIVNSSGSWTVTETKTEAELTGTVESVNTENTSNSNYKKSNLKSDSLPRKTNKRVQFAASDDTPMSQIISDQDIIEFSKELGVNQDKTEEPKQTNSNENIDPNKYLKITAKRLVSEVPEIVTGGDERIDDEEEDVQQRMTISEAFADDDVIAEFEEEKQQTMEDSLPKEVDLSLPGWGSWTGSSIQKNEDKKSKRKRINKRLLFRIPKAPPRKDANKGHVIINEEKNEKMKEHMVNELPFPFTSVKDYEASIRAPIGRTWLPETAHQKFISPPVITKLGKVIEPMDEGELLNRQDYKEG